MNARASSIRSSPLRALGNVGCTPRSLIVISRLPSCDEEKTNHSANDEKSRQTQQNQRYESGHRLSVANPLYSNISERFQPKHWLIRVPVAGFCRTTSLVTIDQGPLFADPAPGATTAPATAAVLAK